MSGLTILCIIGALLFIDRDHPSTEEDRRIDWLGTFLVTAGLVLIIFVLSDGEIAPNKWSTPCKLFLLNLIYFGDIEIAPPDSSVEMKLLGLFAGNNLVG